MGDDPFFFKSRGLKKSVVFWFSKLEDDEETKKKQRIKIGGGAILCSQSCV
jgi:hypothetical protein